VGNSQSDLCSGGERSKGLDKTSEQAQILGVRRKLLFRHKVRDLNPSNKVEARRSMLSRMNVVGGEPVRADVYAISGKTYNALTPRGQLLLTRLSCLDRLRRRWGALLLRLELT
jgi:hypothetical protein